MDERKFILKDGVLEGSGDKGRRGEIGCQSKVL